MDISRDAPSPLLRVPQSPPAAASQWRVGQILEAVVRPPGPDGPTLQIGRETIAVRGELQLPAGERVQLQVMAVRPELSLSLVRSPGLDTLAESSRSLLPRQAPISNVATALQAVLNNAQARDALSPPVRAAAEALMASLPGPEAVSRPEGLRAALLNSGLFLENKLAAAVSGTTPPVDAVRGDNKALLANLLNHVFRALTAQPRSSQGGEQPPPNPARPSPPPPPSVRLPVTAEPGQVLTELGRQADAALARIQTLQIGLVAQETQPPWMFEIGVRNNNDTDVLQFLLDKEQTPGEEADKAWTLQLSFDFRELGPLHCKLVLRGTQVSANWWAERQDTAAEVGNQLPLLTERLRELGLEVGGMRCVHGKPPKAADPDRSDGGRLLDERA
ncbi:hypothetical protein J2T57_002727 [Natronocella acetinitrilica]|uniref:Flagellar hook-length control protein-like C-terminal domain-containing protein n=1 Tax=Natronocella acetinitrilica TaxID=414046 RepID=A0AAE3KGT1_9GAMM|nr:flagellar hook-length control protein FliK [Natronocella acetinitrilica]MCP1675577.1 hypothetical protein [Natronocella acetinitrilica]